MSNTVITNYTDLNGPSTKADSSVVVIVNKDGSLSVDQKLLGTLMGTDGSQATGISVVRVGHEGKPDDATDSEAEDDKVPHVTLSVDSYYNEPNSIIKYDSGADMLQSLRIETRENSLIGFQNDHCYTPLTSPSQSLPQRPDTFAGYDEPVIEITHTPPPKPVPSAKKITILEQQIIPKGKKIAINPQEGIIFKGNDVLTKPLPVLTKSKYASEPEKSSGSHQKSEDDNDNESSSASSSADGISDRDSDSDYKDTKDRSGPFKVRKTTSKLKPRILKSAQASKAKIPPKVATRLKSSKSIIKREIKEKIIHKKSIEKKQAILDNVLQKESLVATPEINLSGHELSKVVIKPSLKPVKKEKKTPAHVSALLTDMTSLFSTPDVIRRVSTENKPPSKGEKDPSIGAKKADTPKVQELEEKSLDIVKPLATTDKAKNVLPQRTYSKQKDKSVNPSDKVSKGFDLIPQIDDASLAQIFQDSPGITTTVNKAPNIQPNISTIHNMNSPSLAGPLSPTLDLLGALPSEEEGLSEDLLLHVAQLVESSENLQEVLDKQVLGKVDTVPATTVATAPVIHPPTPQTTASRSLLYQQTPTKAVKTMLPQKNPIEIVRRDGRVITLPPIEAPATRSSKRKSQMESSSNTEVVPPTAPAPVQSAPSVAPAPAVPSEVQTPQTSKQYVNKKLPAKKPESAVPTPVADKLFTESQESWNSEDDPYRLWCICKQPHNNRFMICCDSCEDWFHGKCVNITKAMGQQMEEDGIEWRCPNCVKKTKSTPRTITNKMTIQKKQEVESDQSPPQLVSPPANKTLTKTSCIVCKKPARASSIYCSDTCILKHAQDSLGSQSTSGKPDGEKSEHQDKSKSESRVIVYERKSGRLLAGPNAPTAENLKTWLQKNPTFEVVRPGTLSAIKPNVTKKKAAAIKEMNKVQTTLNFERIPRKPGLLPVTKTQPELKEIPPKLMYSTKEETKASPKTPVTPKSQQPQFPDTPKASTSGLRTLSEPRKLVRTANRSASEKAPSVSPAASRRKDTPENINKMKSGEPIRDNVRKALQEQMSLRMAENTGPKFTEDEIKQFAYDTEIELHELFRDVGMKYKAKYRSLMFNIKDRKNLSLWQKICDKTITPKQLVRLSPEELASQELAQWRDKEAKYQLELIKKSELDLLAASKTYVLKTHKGEEVMETKESVSTELDPNVPVEDLVSALNDSTATDEPLKDNSSETPESPTKLDTKKHSSKKNSKDSSGHSKKSSRESKRDSDSRKSRSSRRKSDTRDKDERYTRRSEKKAKVASKDKSKREPSKEKTDSIERSRRRSRSKNKSKKRSKSREHSRSISAGRDRSHSRSRSRRSKSKESSRRRNSSRSKPRSSTEDKAKHRSRSQEVLYTKSKNESTDSDSLERPKSAMLKEAHPEYDPHEPMITSAFSEEDLRKSRDDVYDDSYNKNEMGDYTNTETMYDPTKTFAVDTNLNMAGTTFVSPKQSSEAQEKVAEPESDQEPSSTVEHSSATVWNGCINMVDVARFYVAAHEVSGTAADLEDDLSTELDIVGRINPDTVWDYISKMKRASNKDIIILKLQAANDEEKMQYIALYSYLSSRNRLGVVKVLNTTTVKDFYIVPLPANTALPSVLLPLDGPGLGEVRTHLLVAIVIRQRKKRPAPTPIDPLPAKVRRSSRKRSYTPPVPAGAGPLAPHAPLSPPGSPRRRALPLPTTYTSPALSTHVKDKIAATLASADDDEAYSPGSSTSSGSAAPSSLRCKMEELNRQIEEQKQQIRKMTQADSSVGGEDQDEAYSPSRPMTPPAVVPLADIALPSNLQEILATIKQRSETAPGDVDMRTLHQPLP